MFTIVNKKFKIGGRAGRRITQGDLREPERDAPSPPLKKSSISSRGDSVDNLQTLREMLWCDHVKLIFQDGSPYSTHVALLSKQDVHIIIESGKVKLLCHECFVTAMKVRLVC